MAFCPYYSCSLYNEPNLPDMKGISIWNLTFCAEDYCQEEWTSPFLSGSQVVGLRLLVKVLSVLVFQAFLCSKIQNLVFALFLQLYHVLE